MMRKFEAHKYKRLFEDWDDPVIRKHESDEIRLITSIKNSNKRTFVDLGAGYGRIIPYIARKSLNVITIEINPSMFYELKKRSLQYDNVKAMFGDITKLDSLIGGEKVVLPVFMLLENTLGTIEGNYKKVLGKIKKEVIKSKGDVVLSLYRQQAPRNWGIMTYWHGVEMNGEPDMERTDFRKGLFVSKTGILPSGGLTKKLRI